MTGGLMNGFGCTGQRNYAYIYENTAFVKGKD
jgi:hypothetical protein